jgi:hypothetical protein
MIGQAIDSSSNNCNSLNMTLDSICVYILEFNLLSKITQSR